MLRQAALLVLVLAVAGANGRHQASCSRGVKDSSYTKNNVRLLQLRWSAHRALRWGGIKVSVATAHVAGGGGRGAGRAVR